ncbi:unnamed protein product, partial [Brassica rapa]
MNGPWNYALVCGWNDVVKANGLKDGDNISLWSFRCRGVLCFALVPKLAECETYIILKWVTYGTFQARKKDGGT